MASGWSMYYLHQYPSAVGYSSVPYGLGVPAEVERTGSTGGCPAKTLPLQGCSICLVKQAAGFYSAEPSE
jgi:hypothetical protein